MCRGKQVFHITYAPRFLRLLIAAMMGTVMLMGTLVVSVSHAAGEEASFMLSPVVSDPANPLTRAYFIITTTKGSSLIEKVRVTNTGGTTGTVKLYAVDAATGETSGLVYLNQSSPRHDVGAWIALNSSQLTLAPEQSTIVSFDLKIPATARGGDHVGGLVAENAQLANAVKSKRLQVSVIRRTVIAVQIKLAGPLIDQLAVTGISIGGANNYQNVLVGLNNTGTTMLKPHGTLQVFDSHKKLRVNGSLQFDTFLPQTTISYPVYVQKQALGVDTYTANLVLTYGDKHVLKYSTHFSVTHQQIAQIFTESGVLQSPDAGGDFFASLTFWQLIVGILFLCTVISGGLYWKQRVRSRAGMHPSDETAS